MRRYHKKLSCIALMMCIVLFQYGCTFKPLQMSKDEISDKNTRGGIVFGSILVQVNDPKNDSAWQTFLKGKKGSDFKYRFLVANIGGVLASNEIVVDPNVEKTFVAKLEGGNYKIFRMYTGKGYHTDTDIHFSVIPNQITYIGKLKVDMPERVHVFSKLSLKIEDDQLVAISQIKHDYGFDVDNVIKYLMHMK